MKAGASMPAVDGETIGMTRDNCMAYCFNHKKNFKYFGEKTLPVKVLHRKKSTSLAEQAGVLCCGFDIVHSHMRW